MIEKKRNSQLYILLMVGIISAFGPFVTDFYLPALPALMGYFDTTASQVQLSLTFSMVGLAVGQLIIGPLSDKYGRKPLLIVSLMVFCISTLGCLYAPNINNFIFFRLFQGLSGAGGVVISKSIATDMYEGSQLSRFYSIISSVQGLAPICAPVLGGMLLAVTDWKGIFWILFVIGLLLIVALTFFIESLSRENRQTGNVSAIISSYKQVAHNTQFVRYVLVQAFAMGVMFAYIAASPFVFQVHFGVTPQVYSLCFGANAIAIMIGSLTVPKFSDAGSALHCGCRCFAIISVVVAAALSLCPEFWVVEVALFIFLFFLGLILPSSTTLAMNLQRHNSGIASALLGFLMFLFGGVLSPLTGVGNMLYTTSGIIVACSVATWYCNKRCQHNGISSGDYTHEVTESVQRI